MPYVMVEDNHDHDDGRDKYRHDKYDCDDDRRRWWSHNRNGAEREPPGSNFETKRGTGYYYNTRPVQKRSLFTPFWRTEVHIGQDKDALGVVWSLQVLSCVRNNTLPKTTTKNTGP